VLTTIRRGLQAGVQRWIVGALLAMWVATGVSAGGSAEEKSEGAAEKPSPAEVIRELSDRLLKVIDEQGATVDSAPEPFYGALEEILKAYVDFEGIARAVMSRYYEQATEAQRERFVKKFRHGLVRAYGRALIEFDYVSVEVLPGQPEHRRGRRALVRMKVTGANGGIFPLQYYMTGQDDGSWQVKNVVVNGVNLGLTYRNQFASAMQSPKYKDLDAVIDGWSPQVPDVDA